MRAWVKIDDQMPSNVKVLRVSLAARWAYVSSICYCGANMTDGEIPRGALGMVFGDAKISAELVRAGLWETSPNGWMVHDYLRYNRSREEITKVKQTRSTAGKASAAKRQQSVEHGGEVGVLSVSVSGSVPDPFIPSFPGENEKQIGTNGQQSVEQGDVAFRDRYGTLVTALGGHLERRTLDEFAQIAEEFSQEDINAAIRECRSDNSRPYPSKVRERLPGKDVPRDGYDDHGINIAEWEALRK